MKRTFLDYVLSVPALIILLTIVVLVAIVVSSSGQSTNDQRGVANTGSLKVGDVAPDFALNTTSGSEVDLSKWPNQPVLLYFNEGTSCTPCWQQILEVENNAGYKQLGIPLVTIAPNSLNDWRDIIKSAGIKSPIAADTDSRVSRSYGMLTMASSMHNGSSPGHTFVLLDKDHRVAWIGDYPNMNISADNLTSAIKNKIGL